MATAYQPPPEESEDQRDYQRRLLEAAAPIVGRLSRLADEQVRAKGMIELRWLQDIQLYMGRYDDRIVAELKEEKRSQAFVKLTRHKTNSWAARLQDILFPTDDKNWGIKPTPVPKLVDEAKKAVEQAKAAVEAANEAADPEQQARVKEIADSFAQAARNSHAEIEEANARCKRMEEAIDDQLVESDYVTECRLVIEDGCKLGTGILKGPMTAQRLRQQWRAANDDWEMVAVPDPLPDFRRVDPWHFFPDMSAGRIEEAEFTFERHLPTKRDMKKLAKKLNFSPEAVGRLIHEGPRPTIPAGEVDHLVMLRAVNGEGDPLSERYVMWEYHGALECEEICHMLRAMGQHEKAEKFETYKDPLADYRVILHFCNNEVLKIAPEYPMDSGESLYSVWNFQRGETSLFGIGVPNMMGDSQAALNSAWRMMLDNAALSVGPQLLINRNLITPQDGSFSIRPLKVWLLSSTAGVTPNALPFQAFPIEINQQALGGIIELAKAFIDEETGMPTIAQGEQGAATQTLGGMSILFNSANVIFRRIVKAWDDDLTKPTIRRAYDWNMQFNPDKSVKGDMQVDARGSSVLLVREIQSQNLMNIATNWTTHPVNGPWFAAKKEGVRPLLAKTLQTMMLTPDEILATQDEYDAYQRKQQEAQDQQGGETDPNAIKLQIAQAELASAEKLAQLEFSTRQSIAQMQTHVAVARLSAETGMSEADIRAKYDIEDLKVQSAERRHAADIAVEDRRAEQAKAEGESPTAATGKGVG